VFTEINRAIIHDPPLILSGLELREDSDYSTVREGEEIRIYLPDDIEGLTWNCNQFNTTYYDEFDLLADCTGEKEKRVGIETKSELPAWVCNIF